MKLHDQQKNRNKSETSSLKTLDGLCSMIAHPHHKTIRISFASRITDREISRQGGGINAFVDQFAHRDVRIIIDFENTNWADPLAFLKLLLKLNKWKSDKIYLIIDFGSIENSKSKGDFISYLLYEDGIDSLFATASEVRARYRITQLAAGDARLSHRKAPKHIFKQSEDGFPVLREQLANVIQSASYQPILDAKSCIKYKVINLAHDSNAIDRNQIEELVEEARTRVFDAAFGASADVRDQMFQKMRKILYECAENAQTHAYKNGVEPFFAVYCRLRKSRGKTAAEQSFDDIYRREEFNVPCLKSREIAVENSWIEVFIADCGVGFTKSLQHGELSLPDDERRGLQTKLINLKLALSGPWPLKSLFDIAFIRPLTSRRQSRASNVTGLYHLGQILAMSRDHVRLYANGEWAGKIPEPDQTWDTQSAAHYVPVSGLPGDSECVYNEGTALHISIQVGDVELRPPHWQLWIEGLSLHHFYERTSGQAINSKKTDELVEFSLIDLRDGIIDGASRCKKPPPVLDIPYSTIILRVPRKVRKSDFEYIVELAISAAYGDLLTGPRYIYFSDLTRVQAALFRSLLENLHFTNKQLDRYTKEARIHLITEDWYLYVFKETVKTESPMGSYLDSGSLDPFDLFNVLRRADSDKFWGPLSVLAQPETWYLAERVAWDGQHDLGSNNDCPIVLDGYADISHALVDPARFALTVRSFRRLMAFLRRADITAADPIASSIAHEMKRTLPESTLSTHLSGHEGAMMCSVYVTGTSIRAAAERFNNVNTSLVAALLVHPSLSTLSRPALLVSALEWRPQNGRISKEKIEFQRIRGTPFVARIGYSDIRVPRFLRPKTKRQKEYLTTLYQRYGPEKLKKRDISPRDYRALSRAFEALKIFGQTPDKMYRAFEEETFRLGHWENNDFHDLLTVNTSRVINLSKAERGEVWNWLVEKIKSFFDGIEPRIASHLLIFPSHRVTDSLVAALLEEFGLGEERNKKNFPSLVPENIIPIKAYRTSEPAHYGINPMAIPRIERAVANSMRRFGVCRAVILDDGTRSGSTMRACKEVLRHNGVSSIASIVIVDRTLNPVNIDPLAINEDHIFWRWDMPSTGSRSKCQICECMSQLRMLGEVDVSNGARDRLEQIAFEWKPRDVEAASTGSGVEPGKLANTKLMRFGGIPIDNALVMPHWIRLRSTTAVVSAAVELARITPNTSYPLRLLDEISESASLKAQLTIELCSAFLLLLRPILDLELLRRYQRALICAIFDYGRDDRISALGVIALMTMENRDVDELWEKIAQDTWTKKEIPSYDSFLVLRHLNRKVVRTRDTLNFFGTSLERQNYWLFSDKTSLKSSISRLMQIFGWESARTHALGVVEIINELRDTLLEAEISKTSHNRKWITDLQRIKRSLFELGELLPCVRLPDFQSPLSPTIDIESDIGLLSLLETEIKDFLDIQGERTSAETNETLLAVVDKCYHFLCSGDSDETAMSARYRTYFLNRCEGGSKDLARLQCSRAKIRFDQRWPLLLRERVSRSRRVAPRWQSGNINKPNIKFVKCANNSSTDFLVMPPAVHQVIFECFANIFHSSKSISEPLFDTAGNFLSFSDVEVEADMWVLATNNDSALRLMFVNGSLAPTDAVRRPKASIEILHALGGSLEVHFLSNRDDSGSELAIAELAIPTIGSLFREQVGSDVGPSAR